MVDQSLKDAVLDHGNQMKELGFIEGYYKGHTAGVEGERNHLHAALIAGIIDENTYVNLCTFRTLREVAA